MPLLWNQCINFFVLPYCTAAVVAVVWVLVSSSCREGAKLYPWFFLPSSQFLSERFGAGKWLMVLAPERWDIRECVLSFLKKLLNLLSLVLRLFFFLFSCLLCLHCFNESIVCFGKGPYVFVEFCQLCVLVFLAVAGQLGFWFVGGSWRCFFQSGCPFCSIIDGGDCTCLVLPSSFGCLSFLAGGVAMFAMFVHICLPPLRGVMRWRVPVVFCFSRIFFCELPVILLRPLVSVGIVLWIGVVLSRWQLPSLWKKIHPV